MDILLLLVALSLSVVSGIFSIVGLTTIFPTSYWSIIIMGSLLEAAKVVSVSWMNRRWSVLRWHLKTILSVMVLLLMAITSLGVFGYLSKAHIDHQVQLESLGSDTVEILEAKMKPKKEELKRIIGELEEKSQITAGLIKRKREREALTAPKSDRKELESRQRSIEKELEPLEEALIKAKSHKRALEAEVGPLKYIAQVFQDNPSNDDLEKSVRILIIVLVLVFDPFAIIMLIAYNNMVTVKLNAPKIKVEPEPAPQEETPPEPTTQEILPQDTRKLVGRPLGSRDKFPPRKRRIPVVAKPAPSVKISKKDLLDLQRFKSAKRSGGQVYVLTPPKTKKPSKKRTKRT